MSDDSSRAPIRNVPRLGFVEMERQSGAPPPNRMTDTRKLLLVLRTGSSAYLGIMPVTIVLGRPLWAYLIWLIVVVRTVFAVRHLESVGTEQPTGKDYLAAFFTSAYPPLVLNLVWLSAYGMLRLLALFARLVAGLFGLPVGWSTDPFAFYGSLLFAVPFSFAIPEILLPSLMSYLYPNAAGVRPALRRLSEDRQAGLLNWSLTILVLSLLLGLFGASLSGRTFHLFYAVLLTGAFFISAMLWNAGRWRESAKGEAARGLALMFGALGFEARLQLATGIREADPLLAELDLVAWRQQTAYAVMVKVARGENAGEGDRTSQVGWEAGPALLAAASRAGDLVPREIRALRPLLVLVDLEADEHLAWFAERESILIWKAPGSVLKGTIWAFKDRSTIARLAAELGLTSLLDDAEERPNSGRGEE